MNKIEISNLCAKIDFQCRLDLKQLAKSKSSVFTNFNYIPNRFSALRFSYQNLAVLLFSNGKCNIVGAKTPEQIELCITKIIELIHNFNPLLDIYEIYNRCYSVNLNHQLDLTKIAINYPKNSSLEPELFAGLIFTNDKRKFTIHRNGVIFSTGFKNNEDYSREFHEVINKVNKSQ